jgi:hypothetical protein
MYDALPSDIYRYTFLHRLKILLNVRVLYIYRLSYSLDYQSDVQVIPRLLWDKDLLPWAQLVAIGPNAEPKVSGLQLPTFLFQQ